MDDVFYGSSFFNRDWSVPEWQFVLAPSGKLISVAAMTNWTRKKRTWPDTNKVMGSEKLEDCEVQRDITAMVDEGYRNMHFDRWGCRGSKKKFENL